MVMTAGAIDWRQEEGKILNLIMNKHTYTNSLQPFIAEFEELTGIKVNLYALSEQQFFEKQKIVLGTESDEYDVTMMGPIFIWEYKDFLEPLDDYINDPKLTDAEAWDRKDFFFRSNGIEFPQ